MRWRTIIFCAVTGAGLGFLPERVRALEPDEIVVLFNARSPNSLKVARYYLNARKIPATHLIGINCEPGEAITEELYRTSVVPQLRKAFEGAKFVPAFPGVTNSAAAGDAGKGNAIKCLVTTYDLPLRIWGQIPNAAQRQEIAEYQRQLGEILDAMEKDIASYEKLVPAPAATSATRPETNPETRPAPSSASRPAPPAPPARTWQSLVAKLNTTASAAGQRIEKSAEPTRSAALAEFVRLQEHIAGITGVLSAIRIPPDAPGGDAGRKQLADLTTTLQQIEQQTAALARQIDQPAVRKQLIALRQRSQGLVGQARAIEEFIGYLKPDVTESCFDSELALAFSDQIYPRGNWLMNPNNVEIYPSIARARLAAGGAAGTPMPVIPQAVLVARIDGETPAKVQAMIDLTLKTEAAGLEGKIYLDARGLHGTDGYAVFDADLRRAADWLKQHATIEVVLDDTDKLFEAKDSPNAALYCGWYSLRNYQDSAQWVPGAVGYHVASFEMPNLHDPNEKAWVPNLLNRGFCGTLGATDEPYLTAFPKPSYFFPLLLSGAFTQGEVWQVTEPMLSWRIGYVGDPLYNPFKVKPRVKSEDLKGHPVLKAAFDMLRAGGAK